MCFQRRIILVVMGQVVGKINLPNLLKIVWKVFDISRHLWYNVIKLRERIEQNVRTN